MVERADVIILGAGMAGASLAAELAGERSVVVLEMEDQPGYHATGRSAAMFFESYGNATVRALTRASRRFLEQPPGGFADVRLLSPRSALFVADEARADQLQAILQLPDASVHMSAVDAATARSLCPILRPEWTAAGVLDASGEDMDVAAIHQGYLRSARRSGARVLLGAGESVVERRAGSWHVGSRAGEFSAPIVVNATGAWADVVASRAGAVRVGLQPLRRSCALIPAPPGHDTSRWPMVIDVAEEFYFKPDAGQLLLSPANEDPMDPCDAAPEELDIALAVDRFEAVTVVEVKRIAHRWAGLRSFVQDRSPVVGFDRRADGFFWLAGQGGYGIQMAPALARTAAALLLAKPLPDDVAAEGVVAADLAPDRTALDGRGQ
ncbi:MAG: FAD-binding oxidoreductase [Gammaproteobacteria bacterium]|nr:FAD-binding oxidoreductase [Gammaproteobacteria bacterium]